MTGFYIYKRKYIYRNHRFYEINRIYPYSLHTKRSKRLQILDQVNIFKAMMQTYLSVDHNAISLKFYFEPSHDLLYP